MLYKRVIIVISDIVMIMSTLGILNFIYSPNFNNVTNKIVKKNRNQEKKVSTQPKLILKTGSNLKPTKASKHSFNVDTEKDAEQYQASMKSLGVIIE